MIFGPTARLRRSLALRAVLDCANHFAVPPLGERHMHHFDLDPVGSQKINGVVSTRTERKLAWPVQNFRSELAREVVNRIYLFVSFDIERQMMKPGCVELERVLREFRPRLPDIDRSSVAQIDVGGKIGAAAAAKISPTV
jgi:hypothetical protein